MTIFFKAGLALLMAGAAADAQPFDPNSPADAIKISRKIQCSLDDGKPMFFSWQGRAYARRPGHRDQHIFDVLGMNVRQCGTVTSEERGTGYRQVSREVMLYLDPQTGEVLETWDNPFTGEAVQVIHVQNDPVNMRAPMFETTRTGEPYRFPGKVVGDKVLWNIEVPLFYPNPLGGSYQTYVGNHYHAMEIFDFVMDRDALLDPDMASADGTVVTWVRIAQWLPWMQMGSRPGLMIINASGTKHERFDALPAQMRAQIRENYAAFDAPPPLDDDRPNETSWTVFKQRIDQAREAED